MIAHTRRKTKTQEGGVGMGVAKETEPAGVIIRNVGVHAGVVGGAVSDPEELTEREEEEGEEELTNEEVNHSSTGKVQRSLWIVYS